MSVKLYLSMVLLLFLPCVCAAHPGAKDANGGHYDRKTGQYHFHGVSGRTTGGGSGRSRAVVPAKAIAPQATPYHKPAESPYSVVTQPTSTQATTTTNEQWVTIERAVDDRTVKTKEGKTIRLIGCDTLETIGPRKPEQFFGKEASEFMQRLLTGKRVKLSFDQHGTDKYGRAWAYIYLEDGTFVNAELIRQGYAAAYTSIPIQNMEQFRQYESEARENRRGLWAHSASVATSATAEGRDQPGIH